jgi:hypothetical protein
VREVLTVNGLEVVIFSEQCGPDESAGRCLGALFNLESDRLPGGIALPWDQKRLPIDTFRAILMTMRAFPPTEPVTTTETGW